VLVNRTRCVGPPYQFAIAEEVRVTGLHNTQFEEDIAFDFTSKLVAYYSSIYEEAGYSAGLENPSENL
jgi:hypothetical protein